MGFYGVLSGTLNKYIKATKEYSNLVFLNLNDIHQKYQ